MAFQWQFEQGVIKMDCKTIKDLVIAQARERITPTMKEISEKVFCFSEVAFEEEKSAAFLSDMLQSLGFKVERRYLDIPTSFRAEMELAGPGPTIAFIAEYDALPKIGHACGHNLIAATTVGAALAVKSVLDKLGGKIVVIGAPAEESGGGKALLVERGAFKDVDAALIAHPSNHTCIASRSLAWEPIRMKFYGVNAHAGSSPQKGVNALNALIETFNSINALRQHVTGDVRIHGMITHGGDAVNVVPSFTQGDFLVRGATVESMLSVSEKVKNCARGAALATGTRLELERTGAIYEPMKGNEPLEQALAASFDELGIKYVMGGENTNMGSTDVGNVSQAIPTVHPMYEICGKEIVGHSPEFAAASSAPRGFNMSVEVALAMAITCIDLLCDSSLLKKVKAAH